MGSIGNLISLHSAYTPTMDILDWDYLFMTWKLVHTTRILAQYKAEHMWLLRKHLQMPLYFSFFASCVRAIAVPFAWMFANILTWHCLRRRITLCCEAIVRSRKSGRLNEYLTTKDFLSRKEYVCIEADRGAMFPSIWVVSVYHIRTRNESKVYTSNSSLQLCPS